MSATPLVAVLFVLTALFGLINERYLSDVLLIDHREVLQALVLAKPPQVIGRWAYLPGRCSCPSR